METKYLANTPLVPDVTALESLAEDRSENTVELFSPNDFYGNATVLKQYCGLPSSFRLPGILPHAPYLSNQSWMPEIQHALPNLFLLSRQQTKIYENHCRKKAIVLGSPVYYASKMISKEIEEARQSAEGTVVFPAHSTHHTTACYEEEQLIEFLNGLSDEWKPVRICLYWKDILKGRHHLYSKAGFPCMTAGHMYDKAFLFRMLRIICSHRFAVTNRLGSSSLYAAAFGVPVRMFDQKMAIVSEEEKFQKEVPPSHDLPVAREFLKTMQRNSETAGPTQKRLAEGTMGLKDLKWPEELRSLFEKLADVTANRITTFPLPSAIEKAYTMEGTMEEILKDLKSNLTKYPRNVPGEIRINGKIFQYQDIHKFYYEAVRAFQQHCYDFKTTHKNPVIVDCGAYVGLTALFYAQRFPQACIHSFEGDPVRARISKGNLRSLGVGNAHVHSKAVWIEDGTVHFQASGSTNGARETIEVPAIRLKNWIGDNQVDLLRLNIKGAEFHVLQDCETLLPRIRMVIIELQFPNAGGYTFGSILNFFEANNFEISFKNYLENKEKDLPKPHFPSNQTPGAKITLYARRRNRKNEIDISPLPIQRN